MTSNDNNNAGQRQSARKRKGAGKHARPGKHARNSSRPHVDDMPTGAHALVPHTIRGRVALIIVIIVVVAIVGFCVSVIPESVNSANYYSNPVQEYAADVVDKAADVAVKATPDSANAAINSLRERLTGRSKWANTVIDAEQYWKLDTSATYLILAIIDVESRGDENVDSVGNIMQIASTTSYYNYIANGIPEANVAARTPAASIYAGTKVVQDALDYYKSSFGKAADLSNHAQAAVVAQGYNYGYVGWIDYCAKYNVTEWTAWHASNYQNLVMNGGGDCTYGQKIIERLDKLETK